MNFQIESVAGVPNAIFPDEVSPRSWLLTLFLADMRGQEDLYLAEIAKAEAGETILDLYNNLVDVQLYPDGRAIIEELRYTAKAEAERGLPARTELTIQEAKQLILDWLEAKRRWYAEHEEVQ